MRNGNDWVIWDSGKQAYVSIPDGTRSSYTADAEAAYGWHYKKECQAAAKGMPYADIGRRKDFAAIDN